MNGRKSRLAALGLCLAALLGLATVSAAALEPSKVTVELRPSVRILVDGTERTFYDVAGKEVHPIYYNGTHYLPVRVGRDGQLSGSIASAARLGRLGEHVERQLRQIAGEIRTITADPCCHSEEDSPCRFCDWADACHFQDGRDGDHLRYILPVKMEEFWEELERGGEEPWQN